MELENGHAVLAHTSGRMRKQYIRTFTGDASGEPVDRLDQSGKLEHPRFTPEKALLDWLYLAVSPRSHRTWPPRTDIDLATLDSRRLARLAKTTGLGSVLADWLQGSANHG
ncbi:MAG: hypothetical protein ACRETA_07980 [Gammaproteobacteria bacterium]